MYEMCAFIYTPPEIYLMSR